MSEYKINATQSVCGDNRPHPPHSADLELCRGIEADRTARPYTFEVMTPRGMHVSPVTVLARDWCEAAEMASAKVTESGEEVLDVQDNIVVIPDE